MDLAALDGDDSAECVADRPAQGLRPVDDEQPGHRRIEPALDQVIEQRLYSGRVLSRSLGDGKGVLVAGTVDAHRRHQDMVADTKPVDLDHQQVKTGEVGRQPLPQLLPAQRHETP